MADMDRQGAHIHSRYQDALTSPTLYMSHVHHVRQTTGVQIVWAGPVTPA